MSERTKRLLVVAGFVASVFGIGAALYFVFFRAAPPPATVLPGAGEQTGTLPSSGAAGSYVITPPVLPTGTPTGSLPTAATVANGGRTVTTAVTQGPVSFTTIGTDGNTMNFYNPNDRKFYSVDKDGKLVLLSDKEFPNVENAEWNKDSDKAVLEFPDGSNVVYDFSAERQVTLPKHWEDFKFSPVADELEAKSEAVDPNNRWLVTANDDGSNVKAFQALGEESAKVTVSWSPNDQVVAFSDTAAPLSGGLDRKTILPIGLNGENYRGLTVEGLGFLSSWSPNGKQLLYSVAGGYSDNKPLLWLVDATPATMGENRHSLGLNTWADKCSYSDSTTVYCAVPRNLPNNSGLQRALYVNYPDSVYKIDTASSKVTLVAMPDKDVAMEHLRVSDDGSALYFTSRNDGTLQTIRLK
ncbi:MAG: hypothetical protein WCO25_05935 [Candidatus Uhrbacteria bacterium]